MPKNVVDNLADAILKSDKSITEISRKSGLSRPMLYKILKKEVGSVSTDTIASICSAIGYNMDYILNPDKKQPGIKIPVLGIIPAGVPIEAVEDILDYEEISEEMAKHGEYFALKVRGDSMLPTIADGDVVIIRQQDDADSGRICVVMINGNDATLKEIKKDPEGIWVLPHNPNCDFKPTFFTNREIIETPVRIIGVAVEIRRSL